VPVDDVAADEGMYERADDSEAFTTQSKLSVMPSARRRGNLTAQLGVHLLSVPRRQWTCSRSWSEHQSAAVPSPHRRHLRAVSGHEHGDAAARPARQVPHPQERDGVRIRTAGTVRALGGWSSGREHGRTTALADCG